MATPIEILKTYWGYDQFIGPQEEIITSVLKAENTIVLLPTSGGKSICYQVPAMILEGVCIVISPLIALIHDQVNYLKEKNIKAIALTSQLSQDEIIIAFDNLQFGGFKFLYLSPEKLQSNFIQEKIKQLNVSIIAIDEAHCISEWGHDFRPSYLKLNLLKELKPEATFMALTATATQRVLEDIQNNLEIKEARIIKKSFKRENLFYHVRLTEDIYGKLLQILSKINASTIVYTNNRKQTKEVCNFLIKNNFKSSFYHGGLSNTEKNEAYANWMNDETPIMVATNAFGMGINKLNVRAVIHINTPNSLENYIQEAGRAGRDGKPSYAIILANKTTLYEAVSKFEANTATTKTVKLVYNHLNQYYAISFGEMPRQPFSFSLQEFCATYNLNLLLTYNAIKVLERESIVLFDENYNKKSTLKFLVNNHQIFDYLSNHPTTNELIKLILRSYGGIFEHYTIVNEYKLSKKLNCSKNEVIQKLKELHSDGVVHYSYENTTSRLSFLIARDDNYTINSISKNIENQNNLKSEKLKAVISYIENTKTCRTLQFLSYFNEVATEPCGTCDNCMSKKAVKNSIQTMLDQIMELLKDRALSSQEIVVLLDYPETEILNSLKILLEKNKITITSQNKFKRTI
ncbi:MAG TPA: RecQ family ATP-dependent DNA helicase [Lutibacter sp.]